MVDLPKNGMTPVAPEMEPVTICYLRDTLVRSIFQARGKRSPTPIKGPASSSQIFFSTINPYDPQSGLRLVPILISK